MAPLLNFQFSANQQSGSSYPLSLLKRESAGVDCMRRASSPAQVPCTCGKVYIGEAKRRLETRLKEHKDGCVKCQTDKSAIVKHAWSEDHPINWSGTKILQHASHTIAPLRTAYKLTSLVISFHSLRKTRASGRNIVS